MTWHTRVCPNILLLDLDGEGCSRYQEDLAHRLTLLECRLRSGCLSQRVLAMDVDLQLTAADPIKNVARAFLELLARRRVRAEIHPGEVEAALGTEQARVDRCDRTAGLPIDHHGAARTQAVQALGEGRLTNTVIDHIDATPVRESLHLLGEVDLGVEDRL